MGDGDARIGPERDVLPQTQAATAALQLLLKASPPGGAKKNAPGPR